MTDLITITLNGSSSLNEMNLIAGALSKIGYNNAVVKLSNGDYSELQMTLEKVK
jgi:hypothetical protein